MSCRRKRAVTWIKFTLWAFVIVFCLALIADAEDLPAIKQKGVLRHLGVPYANFVSGAGDGLDVELMQLFARHIGVRYEYVKTDWPTLITDLTGLKYTLEQNDVKILGKAAVKGDNIGRRFEF